jgi:ankyrin repeat protein
MGIYSNSLGYRYVETLLILVGCTPLILAATAGHASTVEILLDQRADIEAQSDRTKDTALSLACSGGRQEVGQEV